MRTRLTILVLAGMLVSLACSARKADVGPATNSSDITVAAVPPYSTKEPDRYRALRTVTTALQSGQKVITTTLIIRDGERRREEYQNSASTTVVYLDIPQGRFALSPDNKLFAELSAGQVLSIPEPDQQIAPEALVHTDSGRTSYQRVGTEMVDGRSTTKYRVTVNGSGVETVTSIETFVWIDESLGMPVKSETSANGHSSTMALSNISFEVDSSVFRLPAEYRKVDSSELRRHILR
jgi:hypothetical protein